MADPHHLERFVEAQDRGGAFDAAVRELRAGRKTSHWIWFVFPQLRGLGHSVMADEYGIDSRDEALAYLTHDVLGPRLRTCTRLVSSVPGRSVDLMMGSVDALKLKSSMTLFAHVSDDDPDFAEVLDQCYGGQRDTQTLRMLESR
ncbi:MAG TPA: DUF1810 domain-containing protein [Mycobacterium sp.]|nr:DUF1810 domain-containing protein [Mycobacterium sp.]